jgi:hypothetical protein
MGLGQGLVAGSVAEMVSGLDGHPRSCCLSNKDGCWHWCWHWCWCWLGCHPRKCNRVGDAGSKDAGELMESFCLFVSDLGKRSCWAGIQKSCGESGNCIAGAFG